MAKHQTTAHQGQEASYKAKVTASTMDCLTRQVREAVLIRRSTVPVLNGKTEWHQPALFRIQSEIERGWATKDECAPVYVVLGHTEWIFPHNKVWMFINYVRLFLIGTELFVIYSIFSRFYIISDQGGSWNLFMKMKINSFMLLLHLMIGNFVHTKVQTTKNTI